jgi:hypothetical protein
MDAERLLADLNRWAAEQRVDEASAARARERSLRQQAAEGATLTGLLVDLAEQHASVSLRTVAGTVHRGQVLAVGVDFVAMATREGALTLVALPAVASLRAPDARVTRAETDRAPGPLDLGEVLAGAAAERPRVRVVTGDEQVVGELRAAGLDVLTIRTDGHPPAAVYVALPSVSEVSLLDSAG